MTVFAFLVAAPTSFEGPFGKIAYQVKAAIDTPRFSKDYRAQKPFYLLNLLNLNEVPSIEVSTQFLILMCHWPKWLAQTQTREIFVTITGNRL